MRHRQCPNPACGWVIPPTDSACLLCGTPVDLEAPEEAAMHYTGANESWCASDEGIHTASVIHLSFRGKR